MFQASSLTAHSLQSNDVYTLCDVSDALFVLIIALVMCSLWYVLDGCVILCSCLAFTLMMRVLFLLYLANGRTLFDFCLIVTFQRRVLVVFYSTVEGAQTFLTSS